MRTCFCVLIIALLLGPSIQVVAAVDSTGETTWNLHDHLYDILPPYAAGSGPGRGNLSYVWRLSLGGWADIRTPAFNITGQSWGMVVQSDKFNQWEANHWGIKNLEVVDKDPNTLTSQVLIHPDWDNDTVAIIPINSASLTGFVISDFSMNVGLPDEAFNESRSTQTDGVLLTVRALNVSTDPSRSLLLNRELISTKYWKDVKDLAGRLRFHSWVTMLSDQLGPHAVEISVSKNNTPDWDHLQTVLTLKLVRTRVPLTWAAGVTVLAVPFLAVSVLEVRGKKRKTIGGLGLFGFFSLALFGFLGITLAQRWIDVNNVTTSWLTYGSSLLAAAGVLTKWLADAFYKEEKSNK